MYENFYGLNEKPFQIVPNPAYLYMSPVHENALTYLEYGLMENVGFILLTGEIGAGKTTLVRHIMDMYESEKEIAVVFNTNVTADQLIDLILKSFGLKPKAGRKNKNLEMFYQFLIEKYAEDKQVLLIIDEAQKLTDEALEEVRMLSNLQSDQHHLIQIMLVGQPELRDKLKKPVHSPFAQRIAVNFFLSGLNKEETHSYIAYRLEKAGGRTDIFCPDAVDMIYNASSGMPRSINLLCDSALVYGFGYELETIDTDVIKQVVQDKGGIGINGTPEINHADAPDLFEQDQESAGMDRLQQLESAMQLLQQQVDTMADEMKKRNETPGKDNGYMIDELNKLLMKERKRSDKALIAYSQLKLKYNYLLKFHKNESPKWKKWLQKNVRNKAKGQ